ncbi:MAG: PHP domain-containing protein, partial [Anaerolineaceae bacterium]|nr:PHP domain-containing protein [Anaerolineaceae bacterium]
MQELTVNLHIHTTYSDGSATHAQIADAALKAGVDVLIVTDHNVLVKDMDRYYHSPTRNLLMIIGEEIHNPLKKPQGDHLIVMGVDKEMSNYANNTQNLIDRVNKENGICFIAHPFEDSLPQFGEKDIPWTNWEVEGYTGIEIWNNLSELKTVMKNY